MPVSGLLPPAILIAAVLGSILAGIACRSKPAPSARWAPSCWPPRTAGFARPWCRESLRSTMRVIPGHHADRAGRDDVLASIFQVLGGQRLIAAAIELAALLPAGTITFFLAIVFLLGFVARLGHDRAPYGPDLRPHRAPARHRPAVVRRPDDRDPADLLPDPAQAPAIFYLRLTAPPEITYGDMVRGVVPFIICQLLVLALVGLWPPTATWLPGLLGG